jgi:uncharacterized membrane protein
MRAAICCAALLAATAAHAQSYEIIDLGLGEASAINNRNEIAGTGPTGTATIWRDGIAEDLGAGPIVPGSSAVAINDAGQVTGTFSPGDYVCTDACRPAVSHAFLYTPGATDGIPTNPQMKDLGGLTGFPYTQAVGMNARGQVVGVAFGDGPLERAFRWTPGGTDGDPDNPQMKDLGLPPGVVSAFAQGINAAGEVVGVGFDEANVYHAVHWHDGIAEDLGPGSASSISNESPPLIMGEDEFGVVAWRAGVPQFLNFPDGLGAFFASPANSAGEFVGASLGPSYAYQGGGWHYLPALDGQTDTIARSISDLGWIVGRVFVGGTEQHAVLWRRPQIATPVGTNVTVRGSGMTLTFAQVTGAGVTTLASDSSGAATPSGFMAAGIRYDVTTTAAYLPPLDLCITYDPAALAPGTEAGLRFLHFENGVWADVTTSLDTTISQICGRTQSLSPFAMVAADKAAPSIDVFLPDSVPVGTTVQLSYAVHDNSALFLEVAAAFDGVPVRRNATVTLNQPGSHTLKIRAKDPAGNVASASSSIWVGPRNLSVDASTTLTTLWPPDGRLVDVGLQVSLADDPAAGASYTVDVASDDPSGNQPQWSFDGGVLLLRAQRAGSRKEGRTYIVTVTARDVAGQSASKSLTVQVPHDRRR